MHKHLSMIGSNTFAPHSIAYMASPLCFSNFWQKIFRSSRIIQTTLIFKGTCRFFIFLLADSCTCIADLLPPEPPLVLRRCALICKQRLLLQSSSSFRHKDFRNTIYKFKSMVFLARKIVSIVMRSEHTNPNLYNLFVIGPFPNFSSKSDIYFVCLLETAHDRGSGFRYR